MRNYADFVVESGSPSDDGWTSSAAPEVLRFLESRCADPQGMYSERELAARALEIACYQGAEGPEDPEPSEGRNRGFTFGQVDGEAEWFAEVILDQELSVDDATDVKGHYRAIVGIPLWVRTSNLKAVQIYADDEARLGRRRAGEAVDTPDATLGRAHRRWPWRLLPVSQKKEGRPSGLITTNGSGQRQGRKHSSWELTVNLGTEPSTAVSSRCREVPWGVYRHLRAAFIVHNADWTLRTLRRWEYTPGDAVPVPDQVGSVLAWLWGEDRGQAAILVADYVAELRVHGELAAEGPVVSYEDFIRGLQRAIPATLTDKADLVPYLRQEVPQYYGRGLDN